MQKDTEDNRVSYNVGEVCKYLDFGKSIDGFFRCLEPEKGKDDGTVSCKHRRNYRGSYVCDSDGEI